MRYKICNGIFSLALLLSGCQISSKTTMMGEGGRESYNVTLQNTTNQQMLLNLVRLRYVDFPFFLDISSITTQFSFGQKATALFPIPGFNETNPAELGGEINWQNTPTVSYTPLEGQTFATQLFRPIDLVTIQQLIYAGWDIDRVLRLCIQSFDQLLNAPTASAPMPDYEPQFRHFLEASKLLRFFQQRSQLQVSVSVDGDSPSDFFIGKGLEFTFPAKVPEGKALAKLLKNCKKRKQYYVYTVPLGFNQDIETGVMPRSLMAAMYYLSVGVEIPNTHRSGHNVWETKTAEGTLFNWKELIGDLIDIKASSAKPKNPFVSVKYKNHWFYIDDCDMASKRTFVLLLQLYNLQSSSPKQSAPVLTLPVGRG